MNVRIIAVAAGLLAGGCATSLGVSVPGESRWERRAEPGETAPPEPVRETRLELGLARDACSLLLQARLVDQLTRSGEFRRVRQPLTHAIPWSVFAEHVEHLAALAMIPVVVPVTLWHLAWWVYGRGLSPEERAGRPLPWGNEFRRMWEQAWWIGVNAEMLWYHRAELLPLHAPVVGPWRRRTVTETAPIADRAIGLAVGGEVQPMGTTDAAGRTRFAIDPPVDPTKPWRVGRQRIEVDTPLELSVTATAGRGRSLAGRATIEPEYLARALRVRALRAEQRATGRTPKLHAELAGLYAASGGWVQARAEWRRVGHRGTDEDRATATTKIAALWKDEQAAARKVGDLRRALFCAGVAPLEAALRAQRVDLSPLTGGPDVVADRLGNRSTDVRAATALAVAASPRRPTQDVYRALLSAAADHHRPVAAWCALQALIRHPAPQSPAILQTLFQDGVLPALQRGAAQALFALSPDVGLAICVDHADRPAVQWVLADTTGAAIDPDVAGWRGWWLSDWPAHRWDQDAAMFVPVAGLR